MIINNEVVDVYLLDNVQSIVNRIAGKYGTLPKYLEFTPLLDLNSDVNYTAVNLLDSVQNLTDYQYPDLPDEYYSKVPRSKLEAFFVATHQGLAEASSMADSFVFSVLLQTMSNLTSNTASNLWNGRKILLDEFARERAELEKANQQYLVMAREFENVPPVEYTPFQAIKSQFTIDFGSTNETLEEIFNSIRLTKNVPYANMNSFYKVFYNFHPMPDWLDIETRDIIFLQVNGEKDDLIKESKNLYKKYSTAAFALIGQRLYATMNLNIGPKNLKQDDYIQRVTSVFSSSLTPLSFDQKMVIGYFNYPYQTLSIPVWSELVMNNAMFNNVVAINESIRASKMKQSAYMHFIKSQFPYDIVSIQTYEINKPNMYGTMREGDKYTRARLRTRNNKDIVKYQEILGRLFTLYNNEKEAVLDFYLQYVDLPDENMAIEPVNDDSEDSLRRQAPDLFLPNYSRKCAHRPTIIRSQEEAQGADTLKFPQFNEGPERLYYCNHATHPYPGLRENPLSNKTRYPFIPCCYSVDQVSKPNSKLNRYLEQRSRRNKGESAIVGKYLQSGETGPLKPNIEQFLTLLEPNKMNSFLRMGIRRGPFTFLETVLTGLKSTLSEVQAHEMLKREEAVMSAKQELYDESNADIMNKLSQGPLIPTLFVHTLEEIFNCDIFIFSDQCVDGDGCLVIPRHVHMYLKNQPRRPVVLVYYTKEEKGSHCELIIRRSNDVDQPIEDTTSFNPQEAFITNLWLAFQKLNRTFVLDLLLVPADLKRVQVDAQILDLYGKCRVINIKNQIESLSIITDPLPPFAAKQAKVLYRAELASIRYVAKYLGARLLLQRVNEQGRVREVDGIVDSGLKITFLSNDVGRLHHVPVGTSLRFETLRDQANTVTEFGRKKRIAHILYEYAKHVFSRYLVEIEASRPLNDDDQALSDFAERIVIKTGHTYTIPANSLITENNSFVENGLLVAPSEEVAKRLLYMLKLYQKSHFDELIAYYQQDHIRGFYVDAGDFQYQSNQMVYDSVDSLRDMISKQEISNRLTKYIKPDSETPYFFHNEYLANTIYLAENADSLTKAVAMIQFWNMNNYNIGRDALYTDDDTLDRLAVYSYRNEQDIEKISPVGERTVRGAVIAYKLDGKARYTALMEI